LEQAIVLSQFFGRLFKKGTIQTASDGSLLLVHEDNVPHRMDKAGVAVRKRCTLATFEQLCLLAIIDLILSLVEPPMGVLITQ
jgi:hypothetical protein